VPPDRAAVLAPHAVIRLVQQGRRVEDIGHLRAPSDSGECRARGPDEIEHRGRVPGGGPAVEDRAARDDEIDPQGRDPTDVVARDPAVDAEEDPSTRRLDERAGSLQPTLGGRDEGLTAPAGIDGKDQDQLGIVEQRFDDVDGRARINGDATDDPALRVVGVDRVAQDAQDPVGLSGALDVEGDQVGACRDEGTLVPAISDRGILTVCRASS